MSTPTAPHTKAHTQAHTKPTQSPHQRSRARAQAPIQRAHAGTRSFDLLCRCRFGGLKRLAFWAPLYGNLLCLVYLQNNTPLFRGNDRRQIVVDLANVAYSSYLSFTVADPCIEGLVIRGALDTRRCGAGDFGSTCCPLLSLHLVGPAAAVMVNAVDRFIRVIQYATTVTETV